MGKRIVNEWVQVVPKPVHVGVYRALGVPHALPFMRLSRRIERTPPKVKHGHA